MILVRFYVSRIVSTRYVRLELHVLSYKSFVRKLIILGILLTKYNSDQILIFKERL